MTYLLDRELFESELETEFGRRSRTYIKWVQRSLNRLMNAGLAVDGIVGSNTRRAIRIFQRWMGIGVDGIVGSRTERALIKAGSETPPRLGRTRTTTSGWLKQVVPILNRDRSRQYSLRLAVGLDCGRIWRSSWGHN